MARRRAIDEVRRRKSEPSALLQSDMADPMAVNPESIMADDENQAVVWQLLERLPESYRETMILYYRGEQSVAEVAMALAEKETTIRQRLKRGRELLRTEAMEAVAEAIRSTAPQSSFAAVVVGMLPSAKFATGAATTSKAAMATGGFAATAIGSAVLGSLIGIMGGAFGSWMSWKNAEHKSQQRFIAHSALHYSIAMFVFLSLMVVLVSLRLNELRDNRTYILAYGGLMITGFTLNGIWMWRTIAGYRRVEREAKESGEPKRPEVAERLVAFREQARTVRADGTVGYEAFSWNISGWFGAMLGSTAWMLPVAAILLMERDARAAVIVSACCAFALTCTVLFWKQRSRVMARHAVHWMNLILAILTTTVLTTLQFLTSAAALTALEWTPWAWCILLLFPALALHFYWMQRDTEKNLSAQERDV